MRNTIFAILGFGLFSCASTQPSAELINARDAYSQAQSGQAGKYRPDELHKAEVALREAEQAFRNEPEEARTKDLAYIALRKAQLAEALGNVTAQNSQKEKSEVELKKLQGNKLEKAQTDLVKSKEQLSTEKQGRQAADLRTRDALKQLAIANSLSVIEEPRGMVIVLPGSVLFASGKDTLLPGAQDKLAKVADALKDQTDQMITIEGHTDSNGGESMNMDLSRRRADTVRSFLISKGVSTDCIQSSGLGPTHPVAENATAEGRANNRRVEIIVKQM